MGVGTGWQGALHPLNCEIWYFPVKSLVEKGCFLRFDLIKWNFTTVCPLWKIFFTPPWKNPLLPPPLKKFFRRPWIEVLGVGSLSNRNTEKLLDESQTPNGWTALHFVFSSQTIKPHCTNYARIKNTLDCLCSHNEITRRAAPLGLAFFPGFSGCGAM